MDKTSDSAVTTIQILGREYPIRSRLDSGDVSRLGAYVREKMEAVANRAPKRDLVHVAVLAALNIADDYFRSLDGRADDERHVLDRMLAIEAMVDRAVGGALPTPDTAEPATLAADPSTAADHSTPEPPETLESAEILEPPETPEPPEPPASPSDHSA